MIFLTAILVIVIFGLLVIIHELGHFLVAKREGVKVEEFGLGFPPKMWSKKEGETEYSINAVPLGGFVRMMGEEGEDADDPRSFAAQSPGTRAKIVVAGVVMHLLLAYVLIMGLFWSGSPLFIGHAADYPNVTVRYQRIFIGSVAKGSPARAANLKAGDQILSINGTPYGDDEIARTYFLSHAGQMVTLRVQHGSQQVSKTVTLRPKSQASQGVLGVDLTTIQYVRIPFWEVPFVALEEELRIAWTIIASIGALFAGLLVLHTSSLSQVAGPIGISVLIGKVAAFGLTPLLMLVVVLAMSLAVFNILPIPALDGGRLLFIILEWIRHRKVRASFENSIHATGFWVLMGLILLISIWDIIRATTNKLGI